MRILVTGASGFVGSHVWPALLASGHEVIALSRQALETRPGLSILSADLLKRGEAERIVKATRPDMIVHLAWTVEHGKFWTDPANHDWMEASFALARAAAERGLQRFVGVGTCFEYDWPADGDCCEGSTPLAEHTLYDISKSRLRGLLDALTREAGMSFAWGRLFYMYGAGEHPARLVADIAGNVVAGRPAECSSGRVLRDYIDVRAAGAGLAALALSNVNGAVNVASGRAVSVADIARTIGEIAERPELVKIGTRPDRTDEPPRIVADISRLRDEVGFHPRISLREGLSDAIDWQRRAAKPPATQQS